MQIFGIRKKETKYFCCDCKKKLKARAKTPEWRKIPADQKRCRRCSARYRGLLKRQKQSFDITSFYVSNYGLLEKEKRLEGSE